MEFQERFKGKVSTMTKEGVDKMVNNSENSVKKDSSTSGTEKNDMYTLSPSKMGQYPAMPPSLGEKTKKNASGVSFSNLAKNNIISELPVRSSLDIQKNISRSHSNTPNHPNNQKSFIPNKQSYALPDTEKKAPYSGPFYAALSPDYTNSSNTSKASAKSQPVFSGNQQFLPVFINGQPFGLTGQSNSISHQGKNAQPMMYTMAYIPVSAPFNYQGGQNLFSPFLLNSNAPMSKTPQFFQAIPQFQESSPTYSLKPVESAQGNHPKRSQSNNVEGKKPHTLKDYKNKLLADFKYGELPNISEWAETNKKPNKKSSNKSSGIEGGLKKVGDSVVSGSYSKTSKESSVEFPEEAISKNLKKYRNEAGRSAVSTAEDSQIWKVQEELESLDKKHAYFIQKLKHS